MAGTNSARYRKDFWKRDVIHQGLKSKLSGYRSEVASVPAEKVSDPQFRHELFQACDAVSDSTHRCESARIYGLAGVAQSVEQLIRNEKVGCSIHLSGTKT